jgi:hypothetical protein
VQEHQRRQLGADRDLVVAQAVEHVLDHVGKGFDGCALDHPGRALDGVRGAEDAVERGFVVGLVFQLEEQDSRASSCSKLSCRKTCFSSSMMGRSYAAGTTRGSPNQAARL